MREKRHWIYTIDKDGKRRVDVSRFLNLRRAAAVCVDGVAAAARDIAVTLKRFEQATKLLKGDTE